LSRCFHCAVKNFNREGNVLFVGSPFTCLPFAEFLSYSMISAIKDIFYARYRHEPDKADSR
jgi:hypothetical protein